jgi:hypothetical protein
MGGRPIRRAMRRSRHRRDARYLAQMRTGDGVRKYLLLGADRTQGRHHETDASGRVEMWRGGCRLNISVVRLFRLAVP